MLLPEVPEPVSTTYISRSKNDGRNSQKLIVFIQGNAILGVPVISGTNQFLNLPTIIGTSIKKLL